MMIDGEIQQAIEDVLKQEIINELVLYLVEENNMTDQEALDRFKADLKIIQDTSISGHVTNQMRMYEKAIEALEYKINNKAPTIELTVTEEQAIDKLNDLKKLINSVYGRLSCETDWMQNHDKEMTERPQGEWICTFQSSFPQYEPDEYRCSKCNGVGGKFDKFCKHCGRKMKGGEGE